MDKGFVVLEIDPEFKTLIRPLRKDEYLQLEVNLAVDGCREPIITWNNIIIDGHNRYEICNRLHIPYAVQKMPFENPGASDCMDLQQSAWSPKYHGGNQTISHWKAV